MERALRILLVVGCWVLGFSVPAQQRVSVAMQQLPPFPDTVADRSLERILLMMDAFHADSSMRHLREALSYENAHVDPEFRYYLLSYRAEVLYYEGLFNEAMRDLNTCMDLALNRGDSTMIANVFNMKGLLHENIQDSRDALPYLRQALAWFPTHPKARYPLSELHHIHGNMGSYLTAIGELDSARYHLTRSLELARSAGTPRAVAVALWSLGNLSLKEKDAKKAEGFYEKAIRIADSARDHDIGVDARVGRAEAMAADQQEQQALSALDSAEADLQRHRESVGLVTQRNFVRRASRIYQDLGALDRALDRLAEWHRIDSLITASNIRTSLRTQADLIRSDSELAMAQLQRERIAEDLKSERERRMILTVSTVVILSIIVSLFLVLRSRQRAQARLADSEVLRLQHEQTIAELRIREEVGRDMHDDLGAGLSALKLRSEMALRKESDPEKRRFLNQLSNTAGELIVNMRQIIWTMNADQRSMADLIAYVSNYARSYLDENELAFDLLVPDDIPETLLSAQQRRNVLLVVKEALHNIVKHAGASEVRIAIGCQVESLTISIIDNGSGLPRNADLGVGNGLRNMARRMEVLGGSFRVESAEEKDADPRIEGTRLRLYIPLAGNKGSIASNALDAASSPS